MGDFIRLIPNIIDQIKSDSDAFFKIRVAVLDKDLPQSLVLCENLVQSGRQLLSCDSPFFLIKWLIENLLFDVPMSDTNLKLFNRRVILHAFDDKDELVEGNLENFSGKIHWIQFEDS